jgi:2-methylcitrate dehydratase PrpD
VTALEQLGARIAGSSSESLSDSVRRAVSLHLLDSVGAWIAGAATPEGKLLLRSVAPSSERSGLDLTGDSLLDRVGINCALARLSEIDDIHLASATTPGALIVPAALTIGASLSVDRGAIAEAIVLGYDAMTRLGAALNGPTILYRGIWPTYFTAPFGIATVAARLLGLSDRQAAHALGIALILASPGVGHQSGATMSRWFAVRQAARNGLSAALAAQAGFTADVKIVDGDFFSRVYGLSPDITVLTAGFGERAPLADVSVKPWCAARQTMAATQALKEVIATGVSPADMTEMVVAVPSIYLPMINHGIVAGDRSSHLTSVSYQMALSVFAPDAMFEVNQTPVAVPEEIRSFMTRVVVEADESLLAYYPNGWPARLLVRTRSGTHERIVTDVPGDPKRPFDEKQTVAKFRRVVAPLIGVDSAEDLAGHSLVALDADGSPALLLAKIERGRITAAGRAN